MDKRSIRAGAVVAILLFGATGAIAQHSTERDVRLTVRARQVLRQDSDLAAHNVGVVVRNGVATLWGPIPSGLLGFKAERLLRNLIELADVQNDLEVSGDAEPGPDSAPPLPAFLPNKLPPALPVLPARPPVAREAAPPPPATTIVTRPAPEPPLARGLDVELPRIDLPARLPSAPAIQDARASIEALLRSKDAYRPVRFTIQDRRVYLRTTGPDVDVLYELARIISRYPGVDGVIVQQR